MKRIELFEFEDFRWIPAFIRSGITSLLQVLHKMTGTPQVIAGLISEVDGYFPFSQITDLGSGSGGPMFMVLEHLNGPGADRPKKLLLTDQFPNPGLVSKVNGLGLEAVQYLERPVDARMLEAVPKGLRTMIASFHHMPPVSAEAILNSAARSGQPILIYEIARNRVPFLIWLLLLPVSLLVLMAMTWVMTPFVKPLKFPQLLFTYLIPLIPLIYAWDGQASLMRTYTFGDIDALLEKSRYPGYQWKVGEAKKSNGKSLGYYIMGYPDTRVSRSK